MNHHMLMVFPNYSAPDKLTWSSSTYRSMESWYTTTFGSQSTAFCNAFLDSSHHPILALLLVFLNIRLRFCMFSDMFLFGQKWREGEHSYQGKFFLPSRTVIYEEW